MKSPAALVRTIGRWSLTALMVNSIIGASIFRLPADLAAKLGGASPLSCLAAGVGILFIAGCVAEVSSYFRETGGLYLYARETFGRFVALVVAWLTWLTRIAAPAAAANLFCTYLTYFYPGLGGRWATAAVLAVLIGHLALVNFVGVSTGKNVSNFFTLTKVGFLLLFVFAGVFALATRPELRVPLTIPAMTAHNWFQAMLLLVYAYGGFEGAMFVGGETKDPQRDTPVALLLALAAVCAIYTAIQFVTVATLPDAGNSSRPLTAAAMRFMGSAGATAMTLAALISAYGYLSANLLHAPRIIFAMAEQGDFPSLFCAVHPRFRTPHVAILIYSLMLFIFSALGSFQWNAVLSAASRLAVYGAMAVAVPVLRKRRPGQAVFVLPWPYLFATIGVVFTGVLLAQMGARGIFGDWDDLWDGVAQLVCGKKGGGGMKTRTGDAFMPADEYGRGMAKFSVNLLVRDMARSAKFYRDVVGATVRYTDPDFAALELQGWQFMLHADHTYDHHPMHARLSGTGWRGDGVELRFLGLDPDAIEGRAREAGAVILQAARDYPHGWREVLVVDPDGYVWALGKALPK